MATYDFVPKNVPDNALDQRENWYDRKGKLYVISNMSQRHALNAANRLLSIKGPKVMATPLFAALINQASA